jgi:hypothetical protein
MATVNHVEKLNAFMLVLCLLPTVVLLLVPKPILTLQKLTLLTLVTTWDTLALTEEGSLTLKHHT